MRKYLILILLTLGLPLAATNLVITHQSGADLLQNVATIGKLVFVDNDLQLLDKAGNLLATESIASIRKITFRANDDTAVEDTQLEDQIVIYPNPTHDLLMIRGIEAQTLRVYDMQGRMVHHANGTQIGVSHLSAGNYLLQIGTQVVQFIKK